MQRFELDVVVTRGSEVESRHCVCAAVVGPGDELVAFARNPRTVTFWRSCAKPFQVLPFLESGGFDEVEWGADQLALSCGSHGGEPEHVAIAESMLHDVGLEEGDLACGPHEPLSARGLKLMRDAGIFPSRLHNNCSGKHAAMLARAHTAGWPIEGYEREAHPVQRAALDEVSRWTDVPAAQVNIAVDGCGVTVFGLPLDAMARAYARLAAAAAHGDGAPRRVVDAMVAHPFLVGGTDRFDTVLMEQTDGRILAKVGAEGVHSLALLDQGIGIALKVEDGAQRAQGAAVLRLLQHLGALPESLPPRLNDFFRRPVRNSRGEVVGEVRALA
ncbi:MAG TPA: asparaginase [Gemmatimonadaceae bacterium]|nr:asparaginase [Gemmatimonadaceae bacterium]